MSNCCGGRHKINAEVKKPKIVKQENSKGSLLDRVLQSVGLKGKALVAASDRDEKRDVGGSCH